MIPDELKEETIPGNIRRGEQFLKIVKEVVWFLCRYIEVDRASSDTPLSLMKKIEDGCEVQPNVLKFFFERLKSLLQTLNIINLDQFHPISRVCDFCTLLGTYTQGFTVSGSNSCNPLSGCSYLSQSLR